MDIYTGFVVSHIYIPPHLILILALCDGRTISLFYTGRRRGSEKPSDFSKVTAKSGLEGSLLLSYAMLIPLPSAVSQRWPHYHIPSSSFTVTHSSVVRFLLLEDLPVRPPSPSRSCLLYRLSTLFPPFPCLLLPFLQFVAHSLRVCIS